jgi:hypothetical protein
MVRYSVCEKELATKMVEMMLSLEEWNRAEAVLEGSLEAHRRRDKCHAVMSRDMGRGRQDGDLAGCRLK